MVIAGTQANLDPTAEKLLAAAEEAFARSGIEGASIRQINAIAGQRNTSAIRYHFGSKEGLLEALVERRMGELEAVRAEALDGLDAKSGGSDVRELVRVLVAPLAERVCRDPAWGCWVRVLSDLVSIRGLSFHPIWQRPYGTTGREIFRRLRAELGDLPDAIWRQRSADLLTWGTASLCERARALEAGRRPALGHTAFIDNLVLTASSALVA